MSFPSVVTPSVQRFKSIFRKWPIIIAILFFLVVLRSTVYSIRYGTVGVLTRFGAVVGSVDPGLHVKIPFIDNVLGSCKE